MNTERHLAVGSNPIYSCSEIVDIDVVEKDGFFDILYALNDPGDYDINVKFGGKDIPNGSFSIKVV